MDYKRTWGWPIWFQMFSHQMMNVHPADALEILHFPGTFTRTQGLCFLSCPHTWCKCSSLSRVIYPDSRAVIFGFLYILQMLQKFCIFLGHIPGQGGCFIFGFSAHYIMQMLRFCSGNLSRHRGCFFRVFCTLHHPVAPVLLGTFIRTQVWKCEVIYSRHFLFIFIFHARKFLHFLFIFLASFYL